MRTLVLTPDFPPAPGGIQLLIDRVVRHAETLECRVVTLSSGRDGDHDGDLSVRRVPNFPGPRPVSMLALNGTALAQAMAFSPEAVLSGHLVTSPAAAAIRRALGIPMVQYFHGHEIGVRPRLAAFAARNADACIAVSSYTHDLVAEVAPRNAQIHVVHPGVDIPRGERAPERAERPTVLTVARIEERYKGHDVMVRAMALVLSRIPNARWVVIGDGPLRPAIMELARATGLGERSASFLGKVSDQERDVWLRRAHVFAMPSRLPSSGLAGEGFGIAYLEANAHGCPVIAGSVGGALDAVADGKTGLLVDPEDHIAVADALVELLGNPLRGAAMGAAGAKRAREFAWPLVANRVASLVADLARSTNLPA